jgi:predicted DNA-binding WGR domain protein
MRVGQKVLKAYDKRQREYDTMLRMVDSKHKAGYRRPGSRNPRKARGG